MRLFVGDLPYQTTEDQLADLFSQVGEVSSATIVTDRDTGRSRGFAFIEMEQDAGSEAIKRFNGSEFNGRAINVNEAHPRPQGSGGGGRSGGRGQRREPRWGLPSHKLQIMKGRGIPAFCSVISKSPLSEPDPCNPSLVYLGISIAPLDTPFWSAALPPSPGSPSASPPGSLSPYHIIRKSDVYHEVASWLRC